MSSTIIDQRDVHLSSIHEAIPQIQYQSLVESLEYRRTLDAIQYRLVKVEAVGLVRAIGTQDVKLGRHNIGTGRLGAAGKRGHLGLVLGAGDALEIVEDDIGDGQRAGVLEAEGQVALAVALVDLDRVVDIVNGPVRVGDVVDAPVAASALQVARQGRGGVGPDLDAGSVCRIVHGNVGDVDVLDNVIMADVLSQRADADAVATVAEERLDQDVGRVGLEGNAV